MTKEPSDISAIAALEDELRRKMYRFIRKARKPLTREDVSRQLGISVKLAAFHLDKLVNRGLLKTHYARSKNQKGRGAGRSSKFYEPSDREIDVSIPPRKYSLMASLLISALREVGVEESPDKVVKTTRLRGAQLGKELGKRRRGQKASTTAKNRLGLLGFEPYISSPNELTLQNCPFYELSSQAPDLICPINKAFVEGLLNDADVDVQQSAAGPVDHKCCVSVSLIGGASR